MKLLAWFSIAIIPLVCFAQKEELNSRDPRLNEGTMFVVKFVPASREVIVTLVGEKIVEAKPERFLLFAREISKSGRVKRLTVKPSGQGFTIIEPLVDSNTVELEIKDRRDQEKMEVFTFGPR